MTDKNGKRLQTLPTGTYDFQKLRRRGHIYVDKTAKLLEMIEAGDWYFLSRPRRFGKSLTVSTFEAMFSGKAELFEGLAAEEWVKEQSEYPSPVLKLDMSKVNTKNLERFEVSLEDVLYRVARLAKIDLSSRTADGMLEDIIVSMYQSGGSVVVLIDEYDKPILDSVTDIKKSEDIRAALRSFYTVLKSCEEYLRFVLLTGISKFSKLGVFSAMNNLVDISMDTQFGDIVGYTQQELEKNFSDWLDYTAERLCISRSNLLERMEDYYDGFCFDGETKLYNPFSTLMFLRKASWENYWYGSGSPWWIVQHMKKHGIKNPDEYRHIDVGIDFADSREIESAKPESFLYQAGYLSIEKRVGDMLTLDYPNREVRESIYRMYLEEVFQISNATVISMKMRNAVFAGDVSECVRLFNTMLAGVSYEIYNREKRDEALYQLLFLIALFGSGIEARGEVHGAVGRSDIEIILSDLVVVLELKYSESGSNVEALTQEGLAQIQEKGYTRQHEGSGRKIISGVVVINDKEKKAIYIESAAN